MNRSLRIGAIATMAALSAIFLATAGMAGAAQPLVKNGVIQACVKAKGKNKGSLRVVSSKRGCKRLRGWRPMSWSATSAAGQNSITVSRGEQGPQGESGPEGKEGQQGAASQVEKTLIETVQTQSAQISSLTAEVDDLTDEVLTLENDLSEVTGDLGDLEGSVSGLSGDLVDLEGTVGETCDQLSVVTDQSDEVLDSLLGTSIGGIIGGILEVPSPPDPLGAFECS